MTSETKKSARKRAIDLTHKLNGGDCTVPFTTVVSIVLDWHQELYEQRTDDEQKVFINFFNAVENGYYFKVYQDETNVINLFRSLMFTLHRAMGYFSSDLPPNIQALLKDFLGGDALVLPPVSESDKTCYPINLGVLKYNVWRSPDIEEDGCLQDLMKLIVLMIPKDDGSSFGYSKANAQITGDGIITPHSLSLSFECVAKDVDLIFLNQSLTKLLRMVKDDYEMIRDHEGDVGYEAIFARIYEKCNDSFYLTKKYGIKMSAFYKIYKEKASDNKIERS